MDFSATTEPVAREATIRVASAGGGIGLDARFQADPARWNLSGDVTSIEDLRGSLLVVELSCPGDVDSLPGGAGDVVDRMRKEATFDLYGFYVNGIEIPLHTAQVYEGPGFHSEFVRVFQLPSDASVRRSSTQPARVIAPAR